MHGFLCHIYTWVGFPFPTQRYRRWRISFWTKVNSVPPALKRSEHGQGVFVFIRLFRSRVEWRCSTEKKHTSHQIGIIATHMGSSYWMVSIVKLPSHELTYPIPWWHFLKMTVLFLRVGHVSSLEGR